MFKNKKIRNWIIAIIAMVVIFPLLLRVISPASASASGTSAEESIFALEVAETIEASGSLEAQPSATLTWNAGGVVDKVYMEAGDEIKAGDVLMEQRTTTVSSSIITAQADLVTAQQELDDLLSSSDTELAQVVIAPYSILAPPVEQDRDSRLQSSSSRHRVGRLRQGICRKVVCRSWLN